MKDKAKEIFPGIYKAKDEGKTVYLDYRDGKNGEPAATIEWKLRVPIDGGEESHAWIVDHPEFLSGSNYCRESAEGGVEDYYTGAWLVVDQEDFLEKAKESKESLEGILADKSLDESVVSLASRAVDLLDCFVAESNFHRGLSKKKREFSVAEGDYFMNLECAVLPHSKVNRGLSAKAIEEINERIAMLERIRDAFEIAGEASASHIKLSEFCVEKNVDIFEWNQQ